MLNKNILRIMVLSIILIIGLSAVPTVMAAEDPSKMTVSSQGIKNGKIAEKYGMYGSVKDKNGIPKVSMPLAIKNAPKKTKYFAVYMYDNTVPWVHWLGVNYKSKTFTEDASRKKASSMVQGKNSFGTRGYGGPTPPDKTHTYTIKVYALKSKVSLSNGFSYSQFNKAIKGKTLATATIKGKYVKK
ncbi:MAG: YbhB/YbcL family Raf kinase inhibitor-like protein [Methanobrevibacter sp.]|nr:YbhB/YbcL family Raf kinase inhibitor-like protein [Methanobrevibacter sp.]